MEEYEKKKYKSYRQSFLNKEGPRQFQWTVDHDGLDQLDNEIIDLVPEGVKILEVGCGDGRLANKLLNTRPDINSYYGIDIVSESIEKAQSLNLNAKFERANYWDVLLEDGDWNFVISEGVLFSCTNAKYKGLLMDLLDNTAERGYIVLAIMTTKPRVAMMEKSFNNSINISEYYLRGKDRRRFNPMPKGSYNHPFWIIREGIKNKQIPEVPDFLKGTPDTDTDWFFK